MPSFSLITTCKGRLAHLRQTLPLLTQQGADQVVLVDYDCPERVGDWAQANTPDVEVVRVADAPKFHATRARNIGAAKAVGDWLVLIDGDIRLAPGWVDWLRENVRPGCFYRASRVDGKRNFETFGTFVCEREAFEAVGGYDEVFVGWGGEDTDLYLRLRDRGLQDLDYPCRFVDPISHGDEDRSDFQGMSSRANRSTMMFCYAQAKREILRITQSPEALSLERRQRLMAAVEAAFKEWLEADDLGPQAFHLDLDRGTFPVNEKHLVKVKARLTFEVEKEPPGSYRTDQIDF